MFKIRKLRCEYLENPIGIGEQKPRFSWVLDSDEKNIFQTSYRIQVSKDTDSFLSPLWDSGVVKSGNSVHVEYRGPQLDSRTRYYYRVRISNNKNNESPWSKTNFFETGILDTKEWHAAFISCDASESSEFSSSSPLLRKEFNINGEFVSARVYVTSVGLYELWLNGQRVGEDLLTPGWTNYNKRLQYQTYDVTAMLKKGANAIGAMLGNGWYKGYLAGWVEDSKERYGKKTALLLQLHITYTDRSEQVILSDKSWKTIAGPILMSELYHGESYDARLESPGWNNPGFNDTVWAPVYQLEVNKEILVAQEGVPVRKIEFISPQKMLKTSCGETVIDMGQNMVGWVCFTVRGSKGSRVVLKHAEVLDKDGNFYTENLRFAKQTIEYILKGEGEECFEPHFTYQGFRYVKLEGYPGEPRLEDFTGIVIHSVMKETGNFECSNDLVNQLQHNILWSQKGNFVDIPTDCPQRDERLGWTGDAQVFARTACLNMDTALFFKKWLRDLKSEQLENGGVPFVVPSVSLVIPKFMEDKDMCYSSCGWGDAAVICPWTVYLCYGDLRILEDQYDSMKAWVEYIYCQAENGLFWNTGFHFGDWLALDAKEGSLFGATPNDLVATAFYAYSTSILAKTAELLQKNEDAKRYKELHENIVKAFQREFFTPSGRLAAPTQTAHILALMFNLVKEKDRKRTIDTLVKYLEENNWHLNTGFLGTPYLCHVLSSNGRTDVAYKLLLQTDYPSWLYQVSKGATTIWEHWDGIKEDGSFWDAGMNSFNHYAYGSIGDWLYRVVAGIDTDETKAGYKHIILKPQPCQKLKWATAEFESMYGLIKIKWYHENGIMRIDINVPHNTTASAMLPYAKMDGLMENEETVKNQPLYSKAIEKDAGVEVELGSGTYSFSYPLDIDILPDVPA
jgi:alpha-L-rhamnosidase